MTNESAQRAGGQFFGWIAQSAALRRNAAILTAPVPAESRRYSLNYDSTARQERLTTPLSLLCCAM
jgi:hypothetical protein